MRYTPKDYQAEAVKEVLERLADARAYMSGPKPVPTHFALSAPTGSGKTVIAANVIEVLLFGSDLYPEARDPKATVLWISDSPSLNLQSLHRIESASEKLTNRSVVVEDPFVVDRLEPGTIYFINTDKLRQGGRLADGRRYDDDPSGQLTLTPRPDGSRRSFYEILQATIIDPDVHLYTIIDEAHRGIKQTKVSEHRTLLNKIISGRDVRDQQVPVVMGISATIQRFDEAMADSTRRLGLDNVTVDPELVQNSGLIKETVSLGIPDEAENFDMALVGHGAELAREQSELWAEYHAKQLAMDGSADDDLVLPLLVVQVPNEPSDKLLAEVMITVARHWPELDASTAFAHVFGDHTDLTPQGYLLPYIEPQRVQDTRSVRVLLAKDAVSTGWDCPRAEVLVSLRSAKDPTPITQLLGRMIRTPLARRIEGNDVLNSVTCLLPYADKKVVKDVVSHITTGGTGLEPTVPVKRVLFDPVDLHVNTGLGDDVIDAVESLPSETVPAPVSHPVSRLIQLGVMLSADGIRADASAEATAMLCKHLDGLSVTYDDAIDAVEDDLRHLDMRMMSTDITHQSDDNDDEVEFDESTVELVAGADVLRQNYRRRARVLGSQLSGAYVDHLVSGSDADDDDLLDAFVKVTALSLVEDVVDAVFDAATKTTSAWFDDHHAQISGLNDQRRQRYAELRAQDALPQRKDLVPPERSQTDRSVRDEAGVEHALPTSTTHVTCDADGKFAYDANKLETKIIEVETGRDDHLGWYRNPSRVGESALTVAYQRDGRWRGLHPDFIFCNRNDDGSVGVSLVDPHSTHLADAVAKLKGLARYAQEYGDEFRRILAVDVFEDVYKAIDLQIPGNRKAIMDSADQSAVELFAALGMEYR